ncbi:hypothetical protein GOTRE_065_00120 [Gordonia terrae NBRC 100016]|uniref:Transposase n=1 Tax=Gordonia terrae NBRC 100016 TaxID=1089454 RepID=A0ABQ0HEW2_9ACTN|nr:hypothetical protein GOTRE_065_00120 [Gordonia terrae NBRC 100016]
MRPTAPPAQQTSPAGEFRQPIEPVVDGRTSTIEPHRDSSRQDTGQAQVRAAEDCLRYTHWKLAPAMPGTKTKRCESGPRQGINGRPSESAVDTTARTQPS